MPNNNTFDNSMTINLAIEAFLKALYTEASPVSVLEAVERELISKGENYQTIVSDIQQYRKIITNTAFNTALCNNFELLFEFLEQKYPSIALEVEGRIKGLISSFKKTLRMFNENKKNKFHDIHGIRIIVISEIGIDPIDICHNLCIDCINFFAKEYTVYKIKNYISFPKENGYQSIHIIFNSKKDNNMYFEIQIRSLEMHMICEYGEAKHIIYKGEKYKDVDFEIDQSLIKMDGYKVSRTGEIFDTIGLETPLQLIHKKKN